MLTLHIPDMSCGHCVQSITKTVQGLDPAAKVDCDLASHTAHIETSAEPAAVRTALDDAGYPADAA